MPKGQAFDIEVAKNVKAKTVKVEGEEALSVWVPKTGKRLRLTHFSLFSSVETIITLEDEGIPSLAFYMIGLPAKTPVAVTLPGSGYLSASTVNKLVLKTSVEAAITGTFGGIEDVS